MTQACNHLPLMTFCSSAFSLYKNLIECTRIQKPYKILSNPLMSFQPVHQTVIEGFPNVLNSPFRTSAATHNPLLCCPSVLTMFQILIILPKYDKMLLLTCQAIALIKAQKLSQKWDIQPYLNKSMSICNILRWKADRFCI